MVFQLVAVLEHAAVGGLVQTPLDFGLQDVPDASEQLLPWIYGGASTAGLIVRGRSVRGAIVTGTLVRGTSVAGPILSGRSPDGAIVSKLSRIRRA